MSTSGPNPIQAQPVSAAELAAHTEQALIELVYVQTANDMLGSALTSLNDALNTTQSILNILQALQNLHNQIDVKSKSAFNFDYATGGVLGNPSNAITDSFTASQRITVHLSGNITAYQAAYNKAASAYFGQSIDPFFVFTSPSAPGYTNFVNTLRTLKSKLAAQIQILTQQTPPDARDDPTTLLGTLKKVYSELPSNFQFATVEAWVVDNYAKQAGSDASLAGSIQNSITFAITAAESLNDTQKERVRRYLFIFQEYYQSAAAILSKISQIAEQMAQKISQ